MMAESADLDWATSLPWRGFYEALRQGNVHRVQEYLDQNFDFRLPVAFRQNALDFAAFHGHVETVKLILNSRQFKNLTNHEKNSRIIYAFKVSCKRNGVAMMRFFLSLKVVKIRQMAGLSHRIHDLRLPPEEDDISAYFNIVLRPVQLAEGPRDVLLRNLNNAFRIASWYNPVIHRQELVHLMKLNSFNFNEMVKLLKTKPLLLESCIGTVESVEKLLDDWFETDRFLKWTKFHYRTLKQLIITSDDRLPYGEAKKDVLRNRPEIVAARAGRADILALFLRKIKRRFFTNCNDEVKLRFRERVWLNMLWCLANEPLREVSVLRCLPPEAFDLDGTIPDSDSYDCLPWFFLGTDPDRPGSMEIRTFLHHALDAQNVELFQFLVEKYRIPPIHIAVSTSKKKWYLVPEDVPASYDEMCSELYLEHFHRPLYPMVQLARFPAEAAARYVSQLDVDLWHLARCSGDVRTIQTLHLKYGILDRVDLCSELLGGGGVSDTGTYSRVTNELFLLPLPVLEFVSEYLARKKSTLEPHAAAQIFKTDGRCRDYEITGLYVKEALKIILSRLSLKPDEAADFQTISCDQNFILKRKQKLANFMERKPSKNDCVEPTEKRTRFVDLNGASAQYPPCPLIPSLKREEVLQNFLCRNPLTFRSAVALAVQDLNDLGLDFGPFVYETIVFSSTDVRSKYSTTTLYKERVERQKFLRDFILGLCGSLKCHLSWNGVLSFLASVADKCLKESRRVQVYQLLANAGVVILDKTFYKGSRHTSTGALNAYKIALSREHPGISERRRGLSLAAHGRIAVHRYLRRFPGFKSEIVRKLNLPVELERYLRFEDLKEEWDRSRDEPPPELNRIKPAEWEM